MILVIDPDDRGLLENQKVIKETFPEDSVLGFKHPMLAVKYAVNHPVDMVFTRVHMKMMDGYDVMRLIHQFHERIPVYFYDANRVLSKGEYSRTSYLNSPLTQEAILGVCGMSQ